MSIQTVKSIARDAYARLLYFAGFSYPGHIPSDRLLILTFHRVLPDQLRSEYPLPGLAVTPEELFWILESLLPHFDVHLLSDMLQPPQVPGSRARMAITFDDGPWDNYAYALPVLNRLGVPATFYLPTGYIGSEKLLWHDRAAFAWAGAKDLDQIEDLARDSYGVLLDRSEDAAGLMVRLKRLEHHVCVRLVSEMEILAGPTPEWARMMTWAEACELRSLGHEIGSHGRSHALLASLEESDQELEISTSRDEIASRLGAPPTSFCYPDGSFTSSSIGLVRDAGYGNAVTTRWGTNVDPSSDRFMLRRCDMDSRYLRDSRQRLSFARLSMRLSGYQPGLRTR